MQLHFLNNYQKYGRKNYIFFTVLHLCQDSGKLKSDRIIGATFTLFSKTLPRGYNSPLGYFSGVNLKIYYKCYILNHNLSRNGGRDDLSSDMFKWPGTA